MASLKRFMGLAIDSTVLMHQNKLFNHTRAQLAAWYAGVMGLILSLSGLTTHQLLAIAHWHAVEQELASISGTLHDTLEPKLVKPNQIEPAIKQALPIKRLAQRFDHRHIEATDSIRDLGGWRCSSVSKSNVVPVKILSDGRKVTSVPLPSVGPTTASGASGTPMRNRM